MLKSFQIDNFRLFQHLEVRKLSHVNLIVGKNNSGKSSFLEALYIYASNADPFILLSLVNSRQENWVGDTKLRFQSHFDNYVRHLFLDRKLPEIGEQGISIGEISSNSILNINIGAYQDISNNEGLTKRIRITDIKNQDLSDIKFFLVLEENEKTRRLFGLEVDTKDVEQIINISRILKEGSDFKPRYTWQIVSTENMPNKKLSNLWSLTTLTDLGSEVISALRLIDNQITGVTFIEDNSSGHKSDNKIPLVKLDGIDELLPLKSMGDGMTRLFHIIVALVNAKNGFLLIDEFENGLHWSVQPKVWDIIFQLSKKLNVQVFATTHSRDCIAGFNDAWNNYPELGSFFRLDRKKEVIKATEYTLETLTDSLEVDVEVR